MSIQSTIEITRTDAINKYFDKKVEIYKKKLASKIIFMSKEDLEDEIEEKFFNYKITN